MSMAVDPEVFISYASRDGERVVAIARELAAAGVSLWRDRQRILGGEVYGPAIVRAIRASKVLLLMCSDASLRSRNVNQEIRLAWKYQVPYLPLLLEPVGFPEQVEYWLEGWQWIEVLNRPPAEWMPQAVSALAAAGVSCPAGLPGDPAGAGTAATPVPLAATLADLWRLARYTDQFWPIPAARGRGDRRGPGGLRDLGAPQDSAQRVFRLGNAVRLVLESDRAGYLLLLDRGTSGRLYCLCPSAFAPETRIEAGRTELPQAGSAYSAFTVTGLPGREQVLAIISDEPLGLDWGTADPRVPARVLSRQDGDDLLSRLRGLEDDRWVALATGFKVVP